jgi:hypothetical protein
MPSRGKKKTTMAKLNREARLRERRSAKQARKEARRSAAAAEPDQDLQLTEDGDPISTEDGDPISAEDRDTASINELGNSD